MKRFLVGLLLGFACGYESAPRPNYGAFTAFCLDTRTAVYEDVKGVQSILCCTGQKGCEQKDNAVACDMPKEGPCSP